MISDLSDMKISAGYDYCFRTEPEQAAIDNRLGEGIAAGDEQALGLFVNRWQKYTVSRARRVSYNHHDAEEIANVIFLNLWKSTRAGKWQYGEFLKFFYCVMRYALMQAGQKMKRSRERDMLMREAEAEYLLEERTSNLEEEVAADQFQESLEEALFELTFQQRITFILHYMEGYSLSETCRILNKSESTVTYHLQRARLQLQDTLKDDWQ